MASLNSIFNVDTPVASTGLVSDTRSVSFFLTIKGDVQGDFPGTSLAKNLGDKIEAIGWGHTILSPRDASSGAPTGKRTHGALECLGKADKATPYFFNALITNENLSSVLLECYSQFSADGKASGKFSCYYQVELQNANVSYLEHFSSPKDADVLIKYAFSYQNITFTNNHGNTTGSDDWLSGGE